MNKFGLKLWSINTDSYKVEAQNLFNQGIYDFIELYVVPGTIDTIKKWKELEIPFIIHSPHFAHRMNLSKKECFKNNIELAEEVKNFTDELNAKFVIFHGGIDGSHLETARQLKEIIQIFNNNQKVLIENKPFIALKHMGGEFCIGSRVNEIQDIMEISNCGFCFDIGHSIAASNSHKIEHFEYIKQFLKLKPDLYHLSDTDISAEMDSHLNFGQGDLDIAKLFEILPQDVKITIETNKASKHKLDDFVWDMEYLKKICK